MLIVLTLRPNLPDNESFEAELGFQESVQDLGILAAVRVIGALVRTHG